ncbi:conserved protein of unknown function [Tenacibaculum sp. 190524A02b]|uniref:hypothetical protein n=1 Tax=Tenacibaculum vairaonense TaxID=3137860 RepID=UPI0032B2C1CA
MQEIIELQKRALALKPERVRHDFFRFIRGLETYLANLNKEQLNKNSQDVFGNPLGFYTKTTEYITLNNALLVKGSKIKREGEPYDLEDTGDFLKSITASVNSNSILFESNDPKKNEVISNLLSPDILGLSDQDLNKVIEEKFVPYFIKYYLTQLFG